MAQQTEPATAGGGGPWQPPPDRGHRRLYRRTDDKLIGGVASGLADYFDIDPVLVRIGFVILTIAGGAGILAYLVMWWIVPPSHEVSNPGEDAIRRLKRAPSWVAIALLILGGVLLANQLGPRHQDLIWGLGLVSLGVLLFWRTSGGGQREGAASVPPAGHTSPPTDPSYVASPDPAAPFSSLSPTDTLPPGAVPPPAGGFHEPPPWSAPTRSYRPPRPRRERSGLGLAAFGAALLAVGVAALLDEWGVFDLSLVQYLALALTVLSIGLLVGAWVGRARWLLIPALLLVPFVLLASLVNVPLKGAWGDRTLVPASIHHGAVTYRMIAGRMVIDLSQVDLAAADSATPVHVTASDVAGSLEVIVPRGMPVRVDARVGAGAMYLLGAYDDGLSLHRALGASVERAQMDLDLAVSFGRIVVSRSQT